jgi:hypothetical protein
MINHVHMAKWFHNTTFLLAMLAAPHAQADCFTQFSHRACGPGEGYTCRQKSMDVTSCERTVAQRSEALRKKRDEERAKQEATERAAIESINRANAAVNPKPNSSEATARKSRPSSYMGGVDRSSGGRGSNQQ